MNVLTILLIDSFILWIAYSCINLFLLSFFAWLNVIYQLLWLTNLLSKGLLSSFYLIFLKYFSISQSCDAVIYPICSQILSILDVTIVSMLEYLFCCILFNLYLLNFFLIYSNEKFLGFDFLKNNLIKMRFMDFKMSIFLHTHFFF